MNNTQPQDFMEKLLAVDADEPIPSTRRRTSALQGCDHWARPVLLERTEYLRKLARLGDGFASEAVKEFTAHHAMLCVKLRSGMAEMHPDFAQLIVVLDGRATLVSGGAIVDGRKDAAGVYVGSSITGGVRQELRPGDIVHAAPAVPHQFLLSGDASVSFLVLRVKEAAAP